MLVLIFILQLLVVLGSVGLSEFTEIKMKKRDEKVRRVISNIHSIYRLVSLGQIEYD